MDNTKDSILRQMQTNKAANMLYKDIIPLLEVDKQFVQTLKEAKAANPSGDELENLIEFAVESCITEILHINQYLQISAREREALGSIYRRTWDLVRQADDIELVLRTEHYPAIQVWLTKLYPETMVRPLRRNAELHSVCCADYTAELQLEVLSLHVTDFKEPVLDIGCGYSASLVRYLRANNIEAYGFDRIVAEDVSHIERGDWFTYEYTENFWGTIISHMALSNHYRYAQHYEQRLCKELEQIYTKIIAALAPGGSFAYTPGVQELEAQIDHKLYRIERTPVIQNLTAVKVMRKAL